MAAATAAHKTRRRSRHEGGEDEKPQRRYPRTLLSQVGGRLCVWWWWWRWGGCCWRDSSGHIAVQLHPQSPTQPIHPLPKPQPPPPQKKIWILNRRHFAKISKDTRALFLNHTNFVVLSLFWGTLYSYSGANWCACVRCI